MDKEIQTLLDLFNEVEKLSKLSQLDRLLFRSTILNEQRYFCRALVECLQHRNDKDTFDKAFARAQLAISICFGDTLDAIVTHIETSVMDFKRYFDPEQVRDALLEHNYIEVIDSLDLAKNIILNTRRDRTNRYEQYKNFVQTKNFKNLVEFDLDLRRIEFQLLENSDAFTTKLQKALKNALSNRTKNTPKFELFCQPKIRISNLAFDEYSELSKKDKIKNLSGIEFLLRFQYPDIDENPITPDRFLSLAYKLDLSTEIDIWVLNEASNIVSSWKQRNLINKNFDASVNISPIHAAADDFAANFKNIVLPKSVENNISIEILEEWNRVNYSNTEDQHINEECEQLLAHILHQINDLPQSTNLAIDDFGIGSTKIDYLDRIKHLSSIKIDKSITDRILCKDNNKSTQFMEGIVKLAHNLELKVVAEGVEKHCQLEILKDIGVDYIQGYLIDRAMPISQFESEYLSKKKPKGSDSIDF